MSMQTYSSHKTSSRRRHLPVASTSIALAVALVGCWDAHYGLTAEGLVSWGVSLAAFALVACACVDRNRRIETELDCYFNGSLDLLATADMQGRFTRVNPAWERTLGYDAKTLCAKPFLEFVHPEDREATVAENAALAGGERDVRGFRNRYLAADGSYRWLEWSGHAQPEDGLIHAVARDVTALHDAEERLADHAELLEAEVAERTRELEGARTHTLHSLALAAEYRDDDTYEHTERVGRMAEEIGIRLGLAEQELALLRMAAPLHDVGKIGVPDRILLKPDKLSLEENEIMKTHTALGAKLLGGSGSPMLEMATVIAETHHERWDGEGYPNGIAGERIPLVGRIVAVADVFDALTHDRPYKRAWTVAEALAQIESESGSHFDPRVVEAFLATRPERGGARRDAAPSPAGAQASGNSQLAHVSAAA
ncbi:MAG TPA: HD domain-containing phosphohydrolase [Solirubrobacteraceae bacterium]|nr:HD domain-containing phosphohydrolase [Solirubrobacteraceae bacterium]